jgi:hypothetical protein
MIEHKQMKNMDGNLYNVKIIKSYETPNENKLQNKIEKKEYDPLCACFVNVF